MSTRERILESALAVFAERGSGGGSMREIARRSGVNVATAYHHFGSKRELFMAVFRERGFIDSPPFDPALERPDDPVEAAEAILLFSWVFLHSGSEVIRLAITEAMKGDADVLAVFDEWQRQGDKRIEEEMLAVGLAQPDNVARRALTMRQVIWGTFVAHLIQASAPDVEELQARAHDAAVSLVESWS